MTKSELRKLLNKDHVPHTEAENKLFRALINRINSIKLKEKYGVSFSGSSEGGIAVPYTWLDIPDFGEMLHLRFHEKIVFPKGVKYPIEVATQWVMNFHINTYKKYNRSDWTEFELQKVLEGANKLIKAATDMLEFVRKFPEKVSE